MKNFLSQLSLNLLCTLFGWILILLPQSSHACACGCGIFDVGTSYNLPSGPGGMIYSEYNFSSQSQNWSNLGPSAATNNGDKLIQTSWITSGFQYFWNNTWGVDLMVPSANRIFMKSNNNPSALAGSTITTKWWSMGDIRLNGYYTGFSPDMSTGINFGVKLPNGNWTEPNVDRDTQIGTGSTDLLLGFFTRHKITQDQKWTWFAQAQFDLPILINAGYQRLMFSPGIECDIHPIRIYADAELPVFNDVVGQQLISQVLVKLNVSYMF